MGSGASKVKVDEESTVPLVAVVGHTGSGKSKFIQVVTGKYEDGVVGSGLSTSTTDFTPVTAEIPGIGTITLIDTPGFDFSDGGNNEHTMFNQLAAWIKQRYGQDAGLQGVICMHNIWNEELYSETKSKFISSDSLRALCGPEWRKKVVLVNSHWNSTAGDKVEAERREDRLRKGYWSVMLSNGSKMVRYGAPDRKRAVRVLRFVIGGHIESGAGTKHRHSQAHTSADQRR